MTDRPKDHLDAQLAHTRLYPDDVTKLILNDIRPSFEKHAGFRLTQAQWDVLRRALFSTVQGYYIHFRNVRQYEEQSK